MHVNAIYLTSEEADLLATAIAKMQILNNSEEVEQTLESLEDKVNAVLEYYEIL